MYAGTSWPGAPEIPAFERIEEPPRVDMIFAKRRIVEAMEWMLQRVDHPVARSLVLTRRISGSGTGGEWTRRDHRIAVAAGLVIFVAAFAVAMVVFSFADKHPPGSNSNNVLTGVGLFFMFGGGYLGWQGLRHLGGALRRASVPPAS